MPINELKNLERSTKHEFILECIKKSRFYQSIITCFNKIECCAEENCLDEESCLYEENCTHRILSYSDISLIAKEKYGYRYNNIDTIFDICGDRSHLERHILNYLNRSESDKNKTLTSIINIHNAHWVAMVIAYRDNQYYAYYIDSLGQTIHPSIHKSLNTCNIHNHNIAVSIVKQQTDNYNCGFWALENAYNINNAIKDSISQFDVQYLTPHYINEDYFDEMREMYLFNTDSASSQF